MAFQRITPFLWFEGQAEEAVKFYTSIFPRSKIGRVTHYGPESRETMGQLPGSVMAIEFQLEGQTFVALNGGPEFKFNESISFVVNCKTQAEVDRYWSKLSAGGKKVQCGWLKDKFGVSWQIVPIELWDLINHKDRGVAQRVRQAMLKMVKLDLRKLKAAAEKPPGRGLTR